MKIYIIIEPNVKLNPEFFLHIPDITFRIIELTNIDILHIECV